VPWRKRRVVGRCNPQGDPSDESVPSAPFTSIPVLVPDGSRVAQLRVG
jgi:hypothetical protein